MCKAGTDQSYKGRKIYFQGSQHFLPAVSVAAQYIFNIIFINGDTVIADSKDVSAGFIVLADTLLVLKGYLGVRDNGGQQKGMGTPAFGASDTADLQRYQALGSLNRTSVVSMDPKA